MSTQLTHEHDGEAAADAVLSAVLDTWAGGIAERRLDELAALYSEGALFQGFDPAPGFGRDYVRAYYAKQPAGLRAEYELLAARQLGEGVVLGYARVLFRRPDGDASTFLTVVIEKQDAGWLISHYHVSKLIEGH